MRPQAGATGCHCGLDHVGADGQKNGATGSTHEQGTIVGHFALRLLAPAPKHLSAHPGALAHPSFSTAALPTWCAISLLTCGSIPGSSRIRLCFPTKHARYWQARASVMATCVAEGRRIVCITSHRSADKRLGGQFYCRKTAVPTDMLQRGCRHTSVPAQDCRAPADYKPGLQTSP